MSEPRALTPEEISERLAQRPRWQLVDDKLNRAFQFADFVQAFGFMTQVALVAEAMNHHPEWSNVYKHVVIDLGTHDVGGLSELDFQLAERIDAIAATISGS